MLLLSSSCFGGTRYRESDDDMSDFGGENSRSEARVGCLDLSAVDDAALGEGRKIPTKGCNQFVGKRLTGGEDKEEDEVQSEYDDWISDDNEDSSDCERCKNEQWNRNAWGLLLTESEQTGKFIRVGTFTSRARGAGGTKYFDEMEFVRVEII